MNKPKILYRADGVKFLWSDSEHGYMMSVSYDAYPNYAYPELDKNTEFFSPTLEEAKERERCREVGFRWVRKKYPDSASVADFLQKWNPKLEEWEDVPVIEL